MKALLSLAFGLTNFAIALFFGGDWLNLAAGTFSLWVAFVLAGDE